MRLLAVFLSVVAAVVVVAAGLNRWIDPFGEFYDGGILDAATAEPRPCAISVDRIGPGSWLPFKEDIFRTREARTVVIGTSRVFMIHSRPGERDFANLGIPDFGTETLASLFRRLHRERPGRLTLYIGVEPFWFNGTWESLTSLDADPLGTLRYLLGRKNVVESVSLLAEDPGMLVRRWRKYDIGDRCVLARGSQVADGQRDAWEVDGSFSSRWELVPHVSRPPNDDYTRDLVAFASDYYRDWGQLDGERLRALDEALRQAEDYGWHVVGFAIPYATRWLKRLSTAPQTAARWREFGTVVPRLFQRHGFAFVDLRDVRDVPCGETEFDFGNDGWHPNRDCSMRLRRHLDTAAAELRRAAADATTAGNNVSSSASSRSLVGTRG